MIKTALESSRLSWMATSRHTHGCLAAPAEPAHAWMFGSDGQRAGTRVERVPSLVTPQWNERASAKFLCGVRDHSPHPATMEWLPNTTQSKTH